MVIGGYFELELPKNEEYHQNAMRLNTGRNAFEFILRVKKYKKVFLPYYTCDVMLEPIKKLCLDMEFYSIDESFRPKLNLSRIKKSEVFIYTNYFGICDKQITEIIGQCKNLIIDNSQGFFSKPTPNIDTFYSPRKFFGVPDGAYLYTKGMLDNRIEMDVSIHRFQHLIGRIDFNAESFYQVFKDNNNSLVEQPIRKMSNLTKRLLQGIDYKRVARSRQRNFIFFNKHLEGTNKLQLKIEKEIVPMIYPYWVENGLELREKLIANKIFVATYWPNVLQQVSKESIEYELAQNIVPLPIDQRYSMNHLSNIVKIINNEKSSFSL